jgi:hypothetical protein
MEDSHLLPSADHGDPRVGPSVVVHPRGNKPLLVVGDIGVTGESALQAT